MYRAYSIIEFPFFCVLTGAIKGEGVLHTCIYMYESQICKGGVSASPELSSCVKVNLA